MIKSCIYKILIFIKSLMKCFYIEYYVLLSSKCPINVIGRLRWCVGFIPLHENPVFVHKRLHTTILYFDYESARIW